MISNALVRLIGKQGAFFRGGFGWHTFLGAGVKSTSPLSQALGLKPIRSVIISQNGRL